MVAIFDLHAVIGCNSKNNIVGVSMRLWILIVLLFIGLVTAENIQTYYKVYLEPSYISKIDADKVYNLNLNIDKDGTIKSAFIIIKTYIKKDLIATLTVNGIKCKNDYVIDKLFMSQGFTDLFFDCSNAIKGKGLYNLYFKTNSDIGSIFGYAELTYVNEMDKISIFGTEYTDFDTDGKLWIQLLDAYQNPISNAICFATVYKPNNTKLYDKVVMNYLDNGIYYFDFVVPSDYGVYPLIANCYYGYGYTDKNSHYFKANNTYTGYLNYTYEEDGLELVFYENTTSTQNIDVIFEFTNLTGLNTTDLVLDAVIKWVKKKGDANGDFINFYYFNGTDWVLLPNRADYSNNKQTITNEIPFINNTIMIKINDTIGDGVVTNLQIDKIAIKSYSLVSQGFREVKGSSEIHKQKIFGVKNAENIIDLLLANADVLKERFKSNHNVCIDDKTLLHNITYEYCVGVDCKEHSYYREEECKYGCVYDRCSPNPIFNWIVFILVAIIVPILLIRLVLRF